MKQSNSFRILAWLVVLALACMSLGFIQAAQRSGYTRGVPVSGSSVNFQPDGSISVNRPQRKVSASMGDEGVWTIFVYLCGSDLETDNGMATMDINEMIEGSKGDNLRYVIETGGAKKWSNNVVEAGKLQRFVIQDGKMYREEECGAGNMGSASVLSSFLKWGIENYASEHMGLIFWNHGGGSVSGVCFDERNDYDSLSLKELDAALRAVYDSMTDSFDFIGFDACLMQTLETAFVTASYADYMIGSEESEPGAGWDYKAIGSYICSNPDADAASVGRVAADSFYNSCRQTREESMATLSVIDLGKIDTVISAFDAYAASLYNATENNDSNLSGFARKVNDGNRFGGTSRAEGYSNMVDLASVAEAGDGIASGGSEVLAAIKNAVVYAKNGSDHPDACGISIYYPVNPNGSAELAQFGEITPCPNYLNFVSRSAYAIANSGSTYGYSSSTIMDIWSTLMSDNSGSSYSNSSYGGTSQVPAQTQPSEDPVLSFLDLLFGDSSSSYGGGYGSGYSSGGQTLLDILFGEDTAYDQTEYVGNYNGSFDSVTQYYDDYEPTGLSPLITFKEEPALTYDGTFGFVLDREALDKTLAVVGNVFFLDEDEGVIIEFGSTAEINMDWETGEFSDNFDGYWFSLPDGQILDVFLISEGPDYDIYTAPVMLNGEETNIRLRHDFASGKVVIEGVWSGMDENGMSGRDVIEIKKGDVIAPLYYAYDLYTDDELMYQGGDYKFRRTPEAEFNEMPDGVYYFGFTIYDIYGDYYDTDFVEFDIEDGDIYFVE